MGRTCRTFVKTTSKGLERAIIERAHHIRKHPEEVLPECTAKCTICPFSRERKAILRIASKAESERSLRWAANHGPPLARAYAATLLLTHQGKAPYLAVFNMGGRKVGYAVRGHAKPEKLVAVQHFNDPHVRLVGYIDYVKRFRLHLYSSRSVFACSGKVPNAPGDYVRDTVIHYVRDGKCPHADGRGMKIVIHWKSANRTYVVCSRCGREDNTFHSLSKGIAAPTPEDDFEIRLIYDVKGDCSPRVNADDIISSYIEGALDNGGLIERFREKIVDAVKNSMGIYILDDVCLSAEEFIRSLEPTPAERKALEVLVEMGRSYIGWDATAISVISSYWEEIGGEVMRRVTGEEREVNGDLSEALERAYREAQVRQELSALPVYEMLSPIASMADAMARAYRGMGSEGIEREVSKHLGRSSDLKTKALILSFCNASGIRSDAWRYSKDETEYAHYLIPIVKELLTASPERYDDALRRLMDAMSEELEVRE